MNGYTIVLHPSWMHDIQALMADPEPKGDAFLARAALNGANILYLGEVARRSSVSA